MKKIDFKGLRILDVAGDNSLAGENGVVMVSVDCEAEVAINPDLETSTGVEFDLVLVPVTFTDEITNKVENYTCSVQERAYQSAQERKEQAIAAGQPSYTMPMAVSTSTKSGKTYYSLLSYENGVKRALALKKANEKAAKKEADKKAREQAPAEQGAPKPETT